MNTEQTDIMTIEEVAAYLRIPVSSVYKLAQEGKIPAQKIGRHWRFYRPTLVQWVASSQNNQASFDGKKSNPGGMDLS